ncbi:MAG: DUF3619 family protein [Betaproteobacteria bacterium]|nr:DUF3619 family protein [Betaproteobacteria bacterium]
MKTTHHSLDDLFGQQVARALSGKLDQMPYDIQERLRAARMRAVAARRVAPIWVTRSNTQTLGDGTLTLGAPWKGWTPLASLFPIGLLLVGLLTINAVLDDHRAHEVAEIDAALLTDDLPPNAYTDPGFLQFLKLQNTDSAED